MINILEFEVHNQILERIDSQDVVNKNRDVYKCRFTFEEDSEWVNLNKFVIFEDGWGNSSTQHLGKSSNILSCLVPDKVLQGSYFKISVYAGKGQLITTNNVSVALIQSGYSAHRGHHNYYPLYHHNYHHHDCYHEDDIWIEVFDRLDNTIDSIIYDNNTLHLFSRDKLIESIYLPFVLEDDIAELVEDLTKRFIENNVKPATSTTDGLLSKEDKQKLDSIEEGANKTIVDTQLDADSNNPISNKVVAEALDGKENSYDIVERIDDLIVELINKGD